jgi:hypothetical protein
LFFGQRGEEWLAWNPALIALYTIEIDEIRAKSDSIAFCTAKNGETA